MAGMRLMILLILVSVGLEAQATPPPQAAQQPRRKKLLAIGDAQTYGVQHESVSHALSVIERLGKESGIYDTTIRTDAQLLTKRKVVLAVGENKNIKNLNDFDAVFFYTAGHPVMSDEQKADFLSFIKEDGKGFIGGHSATTTFYNWPEFGAMVGGYFDGHPWGIFDAPVIVEDPNFPAMKGFPRSFILRDEIYQLKAPYSRDKVRVLARLDASKLDLTNPRVNRTDKDFPVAWAAQIGKGRVFNSSIGHPEESWDRPDVQTMWLEAIKWAMGLTNADVTPRPMPAAAAVVTKARFASEIEAFLKEDRSNPPPQNGILFIGSSIFRRWTNLKAQMSPMPVFNRAFGGSQTPEILEYMDRIVLPYSPKMIVYYCGSNDVGAKRTADQIADGFKQFVARVHVKLPATRIFYVSINRAPQKQDKWDVVDAANASVKAYVAKDKRLEFIDVNPALFDQFGQARLDLYLPDKLHFKEPAYDDFTRVIRPVIEKAWLESKLPQ